MPSCSVEMLLLHVSLFGQKHGLQYDQPLFSLEGEGARTECIMYYANPQLVLLSKMDIKTIQHFKVWV